VDRVSEINLFDVRDVRAQLAGNDSQIEVRVGAQDLGARLKAALEVLDRYKQAGQASLITYVDFTGNNVVLGYSSGGSGRADENTGEARSDKTTTATRDSEKPTAVATKKRTDVKPASDNKRKPTSREQKTAHAKQRCGHW